MSKIESLLASVPDISAQTVRQSNALAEDETLSCMDRDEDLSFAGRFVNSATDLVFGRLAVLPNIVNEEVVHPANFPRTFTMSMKGRSCCLGYTRLESNPVRISGDGKHSFFLSAFLLLSAWVSVELPGDRHIGTTKDVMGIFKALRVLAVIVEGSYQHVEQSFPSKSTGR